MTVATIYTQAKARSMYTPDLFSPRGEREYLPSEMINPLETVKRKNAASDFIVKTTMNNMFTTDSAFERFKAGLSPSVRMIMARINSSGIRNVADWSMEII